MSSLSEMPAVRHFGLLELRNFSKEALTGPTISNIWNTEN